MKSSRFILAPAAVASVLALTTTTTAVAQDITTSTVDGEQCSALHLIMANGTFDSATKRDPDTDNGFFGTLYHKVSEANDGFVDTSNGVADALATSTSESSSEASESSESATASETESATETESSETSESAESTTSAPADTSKGKLNISRSYVNYPATAGGFGKFWPGAAPSTEHISYTDSMNMGVKSAEEQVKAVAERCPDTKFGLMGYSQGAEVVENTARKIGAGQGVVDADRIAGVALFASPTRKAATPMQIDGADAVGDGEVASVTSGLNDYPVPDGGGISVDKSGTTDFGALSDRTISWCLQGDLVCGMPIDSESVRAVVNASEGVNLEDPINSLGQVADGLNQAIAVSATDSAPMNNVDFGEDGFSLLNAATVNDPMDSSSTTTSESASEASESSESATVSETETESATSASESESESESSAMSATETESSTSTSTPRSAASASASSTAQQNPLLRVLQVAQSTSSQLESNGSASSGAEALTNPGALAGDVLGGVGEEYGSALTGEGGTEGALGNSSTVAPGTSIEDRLVPALTDLGGMALGATITTAKRALTPANLAQIATAGVAGGPTAAGAVTLAKFSEAGLLLLQPQNTSMFVRDGMTALEKSGLGPTEVANLAVELNSWKSMQEHGAYGDRAMMPDGRTAVEATSDWMLASAGQTVGETSTSVDKPVAGAGIGETTEQVDFDKDAAASALADLKS